MSGCATQDNALRRTFDAAKVQRAYAGVAPVYDFWSKLTESRAANRALELAEIQVGEAALEVAVGTGLAFEEVLKRNPSGRNIGIDLSPGMLLKASARLKARSQGRLQLLLGDALQLPFKESGFDLVFNHYMLDLLPEDLFQAILLEFKRILKNSGRVVIVTMAEGTKTVHGFWRMLARRAPALLTDCRPVSVGPHLEQAGFSNIIVESVSQNTFPSEIIRAEL